MPSPELGEFLEQARLYRCVPVYGAYLADGIKPVEAFRRIVRDGYGFLLESFEQAGRWSRYSYVGRSPLLRVVKKDGKARLEGARGQSIPESTSVLRLIKEVLKDLSVPPTSLPPLHSGLVGYLGYDVVREIERLTDPPPDDLKVPEAVMEVIGELLAFDHFRDVVYVVVNVLTEEGIPDAELTALYHRACRRVEELRAQLSSGGEEAELSPVPLVKKRVVVGKEVTSKAQFLSAVKRAKHYIKEGDIFQVVLSQRFDFQCSAEPFSIYRALRHINPSPYLFFLRYPELTILGSSPESMVKVEEKKVVARPIAGTRRRGRTDEEDAALAGELLEDRKERAEHVMLVDLARNDLGKVARFGTVKTEELMVLERYSHVMHLTSQVSGLLRDGVDLVDVIAATFPAGTLSGAPKVRAMEIIDELEPVKRGVYGGVVGYMDAAGGLDTAIAIRTLVVTNDGTMHLQAGAGIVADSEPELEYKECLNKANALIEAMECAP